MYELAQERASEGGAGLVKLDSWASDDLIKINSDDQAKPESRQGIAEINYSDKIGAAAAAKAFEIIGKILRNAITGESRPIGRDNSVIVKGLGTEQRAASAVLTALGFHISEQDNKYYPPQLSSDADAKRAVLGYQEIELFACNARNKAVIGPPQGSIPDYISAAPAIVRLVAPEYPKVKGEPAKKRRVESDAQDAAFADACFTLGVAEDFSIDAVAWSYQLQVSEIDADGFQLEERIKMLDALQTFIEQLGTKPAALVKICQSENDEGIFTQRDIKAAYVEFGITEQAQVPDETLIEIFKIRCVDNTSARKTYIGHLRVLQISRKSEYIAQFIKTIELGGEPEVEPKPVDRTGDLPVGLANIGNTCYLNSLLQYYFTLKTLREKVLNTSDDKIRENSLDWQKYRCRFLSTRPESTSDTITLVNLVSDDEGSASQGSNAPAATEDTAEPTNPAPDSPAFQKQAQKQAQALAKEANMACRFVHLLRKLFDAMNRAKNSFVEPEKELP